MFTKIDPKDLNENPFSLIGDQWMLVTAGDRTRCNTMTASWGGVGIMWGKPCATAYIRPQRYTKEFMDREDYFTLSFLPQQYRKELSFCGSKSGRDVEKFAACGLTAQFAACGAPYVEEAELVLVCKKLYVQPLRPECVVDHAAVDHWYQDDYHWMYLGEIVETLKK